MAGEGNVTHGLQQENVDAQPQHQPPGELGGGGAPVQRDQEVRHQDEWGGRRLLVLLVDGHRDATVHGSAAVTPTYYEEVASAACGKVPGNLGP